MLNELKWNWGVVIVKVKLKYIILVNQLGCFCSVLHAFFVKWTTLSTTRNGLNRLNRIVVSCVFLFHIFFSSRPIPSLFCWFPFSWARRWKSETLSGSHNTALSRPATRQYDLRSLTGCGVRETRSSGSHDARSIVVRLYGFPLLDDSAETLVFSAEAVSGSDFSNRFGEGHSSGCTFHFSLRLRGE